MTIASAFNEITVAQGGTASTSGSIAGAIDKLNDVLAGSDQEAASTIEQAVRLLGQHIGGGSSVTVEALTATENKTYTAPSGKAYSPVTVNVSGGAPEGWYFISEDANTHLDKTWNEINTMYDNGAGLIFILPHDESVDPAFVEAVFTEDGMYGIPCIDFYNHDVQRFYATDNANGYPTLYTP